MGFLHLPAVLQELPCKCWSAKWPCAECFLKKFSFCLSLPRTLFSQSLSVFFRLFQRPSLFDSFARTHTYAHTLSHWLICLFSSSTVQIEVMALGNCSNCHLAFWWERWGEESTLLGVILCLSPVSVFAPSLGPLSYLILTWKDLLVQLFLSKCQTQTSTVHQKTPLFSYCLSCL